MENQFTNWKACLYNFYKICLQILVCLNYNLTRGDSSFCNKMLPFTSAMLTNVREVNKTDAIIKAVTGFTMR